jgi:hypothetical protein
MSEAGKFLLVTRLSRGTNCDILPPVELRRVLSEVGWTGKVSKLSTVVEKAVD